MGWPGCAQAGLLDGALASKLKALIPAGPKDPTLDAAALETQRLALAGDDALHKAILAEV